MKCWPVGRLMFGALVSAFSSHLVSPGLSAQTGNLGTAAHMDCLRRLPHF